MDKTKISFFLNGNAVEVIAHPITRLIDVLRNELQATGTKEGCGEGECGACAILLNGALVNSCLIPIVQAQGAQLRTIEGLMSGSELSALQQGFIKTNGAQCGFCTPGMIMAAVALLESNPKPSEADIREAMSGNLCRCTGYERIIQAVQWAAEILQKNCTVGETKC